MQDPVEEAATRLTKSGLIAPGGLVGCSDSDIEQIESIAGGRLPGMYRSFLKRMGRSAGGFMVGTDLFFPTILTVRKQAEALQRECGGQFSLAEKNFVFACHQGYQFLFFSLLFGDDPPVYRFLEGDSAAQEVFPRFSDWLKRCVADELGAGRSAS